MNQGIKRTVLMISDSQFLLEGLSHIIKGQKDYVEIVTRSLDPTLEEFVAQTNPQLVFIDNRISEIDIDNLLDSVHKTNPDIKFILFKDQNRVKAYDSSNVILITRESDSLELLSIIYNQGCNITDEKVSENLAF
jgi:DNA-binding NtrC family response regulator